MLSRLLSKRFSSSTVESGYLLPTVIILGLAVGTVSVAALQTVAQNGTTLNDQYYSTLAREAAQAGIVTANKCLSADTGATWTTLVGTNCSGGGAPSIVGTGENYTSGYSVATPDRTTLGSGTVLVSSTGIVTLTNSAGQRVKTVKASVRAYAKTTAATSPTRSSKYVVGVSTGYKTACATTNDTRVNDHWVYCWGYSGNNQIGDGWSSDRKAPVEVQRTGNPMEGKYVTEVSVGTTHTCAVATEPDGSKGRAYCWGKNDAGQLGNNSTSTSKAPVAVVSTSGALFDSISGIPKTVTHITAGFKFTCATTSDEKVSCWGDNGYGQLGTGNRTDSRIPVAVATDSSSGINTTTKIAKLARIKHDATTMCAIDTTDKAYCWGQNYSGQVGNGVKANDVSRSTTGCTNNNKIYYTINLDTSVDALKPVAVQTSEKFSDIIIYGNGDSDNSREYVTGLTTVGSAHPSRMYWWGGSQSFGESFRVCGSDRGGGNKWASSAWRKYNAQTTPAGPLYDGTSTGNINKQPLALVSGFAYAGDYSQSNIFCAVTAGTLFCDDDTGNATLPAAVRTVTPSDLMIGMNINAIDTGPTNFSCVMADNTVLCWGTNDKGQLGINSNASSKNWPTATDVSSDSDLGTSSGVAGPATITSLVYF